ncbi:UNVERIFIED_CONTAM: hypothetical protein FKN15_032930 [Acipenser sinensis]
MSGKDMNSNRIVEDMEVKPINKRASGQSYEVILKAPADLSPDRPQPLSSPPKKKDMSLDDLQKRLEAAEERRKSMMITVKDQDTLTATCITYVRISHLQFSVNLVSSAQLTAAPAMASSEVSVHVEEVVVVTTPDTATDGSAVEEVKTVLVTTDLSQQRFCHWLAEKCPQSKGQPPRLLHHPKINGSPATFTVEPSDDSAEWITTIGVNGSPATFTVEPSDDSAEWITTIGEDTVTFWRGLKDAGLLDEVIEAFQNEVKETLKGLQDRIQQPPLQITALEQQCDEHRKRAKELKSKSQHLNNVLMTLTPVSTAPTPKRPRLTRATSGPASVAAHVSAHPTQITLTSALPVTQLTNLPLGKVVSAVSNAPQQTATFTTTNSPLLGGYTVLASPGTAIPNTVEIQPDASNLTVLSTAAIQDGSTIVKVMSPFQLLTLPALGATLQNMAAAGGTLMAVPTSTVETSVTQIEESAVIEVKDAQGEKQ